MGDNGGGIASVGPTAGPILRDPHRQHREAGQRLPADLDRGCDTPLDLGALAKVGLLATAPEQPGRAHQVKELQSNHVGVTLRGAVWVQQQQLLTWRFSTFHRSTRRTGRSALLPRRTRGICSQQHAMGGHIASILAALVGRISPGPGQNDLPRQGPERSPRCWAQS